MHCLDPVGFSYPTTTIMTSNLTAYLTPWSSVFTGWITRALILNATELAFSPHNYAHDIVFGVTTSSMLDPSDFDLTLYRPNLAVDGRGRLLALNSSDFDGLASLAQKVVDYPVPEEAGEMRSWDLALEYTCSPGHNLFVSPTAHPANEYGDWGGSFISGVHKESTTILSWYRRALAEGKPIPRLPEPIREFWGLIFEQYEDITDWWEMRGNMTEADKQLKEDARIVLKEARRGIF
ncbi:hypothetical protein DL96DRAFT_1590508 [Flagelloscypha sp. PMI_526]|nr:hypothetical protein DL96DRAFT_1590508 [Flagelloscypha sp. PMI_526]